MQIDILKKIIKEVVRDAIREELSLLYENRSSHNDTENNVINTFTENRRPNTAATSIQNILEETQKELTNQDFKNFIGNSGIISENSGYQEPNHLRDSNNHIGLDISKLDFVNKASEIYKIIK